MLNYFKKKQIIVSIKYEYLNATLSYVLFKGTIIANKPVTRIIETPKVVTSPRESVNEDIKNVSMDDLTDEEFEISSDFQT